MRSLSDHLSCRADGDVCSDAFWECKERRVAKRPKNSISKSSPDGTRIEGGTWRRHMIKLWLALLAASLTAMWQVYQGWLSSTIERRATAIWAHVFDKPMAEGVVTRLDFRFGLQENADTARFERTRVTLWPGRCKRAGGDTLTRTFDRDNSHQHVILQVSCNYNGRIKVTLTPLFGEQATIYDGLPNDQETHPFAGVPGSYRFGQLQITRVYTDTSRVPVNSCQLMSSCNELDPSYPD